MPCMTEYEQSFKSHTTVSQFTHFLETHNIETIERKGNMIIATYTIGKQ